MAQDSFPLIARQSQDAEGPLKVKALQIVFDMLILHGMDFGADRKFGVCPSNLILLDSSRTITRLTCFVLAARCHPRFLG